MSLGSITYTAVTWTTGDTITEAKLDNMVANDQAYDAHAAQGILLNNTIGFWQKDSGGTNRSVANIDSSNYLNIGDSGLAGLKHVQGVYAEITGSNVATVAGQSNIVGGTETKDPKNLVAAGVFTAPIAGQYLITFSGTLKAMAVGKELLAVVRKNGTNTPHGFRTAQAPFGGYDVYGSLAVVITLAATDTLVIRVENGDSVSRNLDFATCFMLINNV
jgi:hypothetical protein